MRSSEMADGSSKISAGAQPTVLRASPRNRWAVDQRSRYVLTGARVEERDECYIVVDGSGQKLAHLYFEDELIRQGILKRLGKDDAWRIARAITRIPALLRRD
jgi:hypothetical protein